MAARSSRRGQALTRDQGKKHLLMLINAAWPVSATHIRE
jgi:hypothetical protein